MPLLRLLSVCAALLLAGCGNFLNLKQNLEEYQSHYTAAPISVRAEDCANCLLFAVIMARDEPGKVLSFRLLTQDESWRALLPKNAGSVFAFRDLDQDFTYSATEPYAEFPLPVSVSAGQAPDAMLLHIPARPSAPAGNPPGSSLLGALGAIADGFHLHSGSLTTLDDPRFSAEFARQGMWEALDFIRQERAGIYFLEPYDATRTPVLFVHGISGHPGEFKALLASLDRRRFQPWFFYYPSGLEIPTVSSGLHSLLSKLHYQHRFTDLHIVAHSMGGLAVRALLADCEQARSCPYLRSFISLSSPFGGDWAAQSGVDHSPVVMPVWRSMARQGPFMRTLFARPLPRQLSHHAGFGFLNEGLFSHKSGDGVIPLESQLRAEMQQQATSIRGFNTTHAGILEDPAAIAWVMALLEQAAH
ncbi:MULTISPECIES: alpha/beta hydrolase [unclassified Uliginosibacterium]|uniref:alpha/beta hydrolase n=1 Tax=unclassified Uliginosibacterium TaxID=2621521 RepID=UPI000C7D1A94|nr:MULTISPECIES: alpha/beta hydrolase [unclassified Uliginosibacterium]MDO6387526.1 alpha/beta hydrolase [Uliginosibacterium sp. 31-12]PLK47424.1 hypothetical protein C0V76_17375 [Uliginosibacterium sp. TH139]